MSSHVVQIVQRMSPGGLEVLALRLASVFDPRHVIVSLEGESDELKREWPRLADLPFGLEALRKKPGFDAGLLARLARFLKSSRPDAVMTHHAGPLIYGGIAARMAGVKTHLHVEHDVWHLSSPRRRLLVSGFGRLLRPTVVGVSEKMRGALASTYKTCDIHIVPNGVDLPETSMSRDEARRALGLPPRAMVVGAAGRLEAVKGHDVLIAAMTRLPDDVLLVIAGEGSMRARLEDDAARLRVADRVRFLGHRDDLNAIYPAFDVFCQPSRNEGLPLTILEAQALGVPVVASAVGDVPLGVCPLSGELAPPDDPETLSAALARTLRKPRPSPREFITRHFDFRATAEGYSRLIEG